MRRKFELFLQMLKILIVRRLSRFDAGFASVSANIGSSILQLLELCRAAALFGGLSAPIPFAHTDQDVMGFSCTFGQGHPIPFPRAFLPRLTQ